MTYLALQVCQRCHIGKSAEDFNLDASKPDGLQDDCRDCRKLYLGSRAAASRERGSPAVSSKTCSACAVEKPAAEFTPNHYAADGLSHKCKVRGCSECKARALSGGVAVIHPSHSGHWSSVH